MKRIISLILVSVMALALLAACGGGTEESKGGNNSTSGNTSTAAGDESEAKERTLEKGITIKIGIPVSTNVLDYYDNAYTKWLEEQSGYKLEFIMLAASSTDYKSQIATRLPDPNDDVDIFFRCSVGRYVYEEYGEDEYLVDLKPYYDDKEFSKPFWDFMEKMKAYDEITYRSFLRRMEDNSDSHGWYCVPHLEQSSADLSDYKVFINKLWLDKLGLKMPTTVDELHSVLTAFKNAGDLNGNGKQDELPLVARNSSYSGGDVYKYLINNFVYADDANYFTVSPEGKLYLPWVTDQYREALKLIKQWTDEGLIPTNVTTINNTDWKSLVNPADQIARVGVIVGHPSICFVENNNATVGFEALPYFSTQYCVENEPNNTFSTFISANTDHPDECFDLLMTIFTEESAVRQRYGEKGVDWVDADPGELSFTGDPAKTKMIRDIWGSPNSSCWCIVGATGLWAAENEEMQIPSDANEWMLNKFRIFGDQVKYWQAQKATPPTKDTLCPPIAYDDDVRTETESMLSNLKTKITRSRDYFCTGNNDAVITDDAQWATYLKELDELGMKEWLEMAQPVYEKMYVEQ